MTEDLNKLALEHLYKGDSKAVIAQLDKIDWQGWADDKGNSWFHHAAWVGDSRVMTILFTDYLLEQGLGNFRSAINKQNNSGDTALHMAAKSHQGYPKQVIELICDNGSDPNIENNSGETALKIAKRFGHDDCVEIMERPRELQSEGVISPAALGFAPSHVDSFVERTRMSFPIKVPCCPQL